MAGVVIASAGMALRFFSDAQRDQLSGFPPEVDAEVLDRFFTVSGARPV